MEHLDILSLVIFGISIIFYSAKEKLTHHYGNSVFSTWNQQYWNPDISWRNKYAWDSEGELIPVEDAHIGCLMGWYYSLFNIKYLERWFTSATLTVFVTDGFHLTQFFFNWLLYTAFAVLFQDFLIALIAYAIVRSLVFNLFYSIIFEKRE